MKHHKYSRFSFVLFFCSCLVIGLADANEQGKAIARLGDVTITEHDLAAELSAMPVPQREQALSKPDGLSRVVGAMLFWRTVAAEAQAKDFHQRPEVAASLQMAQERLLGELYLLQADNTALSDERLESLARAEYLVDQERFKTPEERHARHILISAEREEAERVQRLQAVQAALAAGTAFEAIAREYSDDPGSGPSGGDLGFFKRGQMVTEFDSAAFSLQPGQISDPVQTRFGTHIIQLLEIRPEAIRPFEDVRNQLRTELRAKLASESRRSRAEAMQNDPSLWMDETLIREFAEKAQNNGARASGAN